MTCQRQNCEEVPTQAITTNTSYDMGTYDKVVTDTMYFCEEHATEYIEDVESGELDSTDINAETHDSVEYEIESVDDYSPF